jgi:hypothetical protein
MEQGLKDMLEKARSMDPLDEYHISAGTLVLIIERVEELEKALADANDYDSSLVDNIRKLSVRRKF